MDAHKYMNEQRIWDTDKHTNTMEVYSPVKKN